MPATWKQQALIEAPVTDVWSLLEDPDRYSQWNGETVAVTGVPTKIEKGSTFEMTGRGPLGKEATTTFKVEEFDDLHEIKLRCQTSGFYSHWILTDAQGGTFAEVEMGVERIAGLEGRIAGAMHTKRYLRRALDQTLDGVRRAVAAAGGLGGSAARK
jgi:uncharacterized protein YndB with AHSA1/START domain